MGGKEESNASCSNNLGTTTDFIDRSRNPEEPAIFYGDYKKVNGRNINTPSITWARAILLYVEIV